MYSNRNAGKTGLAWILMISLPPTERSHCLYRSSDSSSVLDSAPFFCSWCQLAWLAGSLIWYTPEHFSSLFTLLSSSCDALCIHFLPSLPIPDGSFSYLLKQLTPYTQANPNITLTSWRPNLNLIRHYMSLWWLNLTLNYRSLPKETKKKKIKGPILCKNALYQCSDESCHLSLQLIIGSQVFLVWGVLDQAMLQ